VSGELRASAATSPPSDKSTGAALAEMAASDNPVLALTGTAAMQARACVGRALADGRDGRRFPEYQARRLSRRLRRHAAELRAGQVETVDGGPLTPEQRAEHRAVIEQYEQALAGVRERLREYARLVDAVTDSHRSLDRLRSRRPLPSLVPRGAFRRRVRCRASKLRRRRTGSTGCRSPDRPSDDDDPIDVEAVA
jgi:hypothetical protein